MYMYIYIYKDIHPVCDTWHVPVSFGLKSLLRSAIPIVLPLCAIPMGKVLGEEQKVLWVSTVCWELRWSQQVDLKCREVMAVMAVILWDTNIQCWHDFLEPFQMSSTWPGMEGCAWHVMRCLVAKTHWGDVWSYCCDGIHAMCLQTEQVWVGT